METSDFDYLLGIIEGSRLSRKKKGEVAMMLLDQSPASLALITAQVRADEDSFEVFALTALSSEKLYKQREEGKEFLTYDQSIIKDAMQQVWKVGVE